MASLIDSGKETAEKNRETNSRTYDRYYGFKEAIQSARSGIQELSRTRTTIIVVDELDRCLPDYAIRVLERLHHLFTGLTNVAVILAVDKRQLDQSVTQIFGDKTDTEKYLKKFINFEIQLDIGQIKGGFIEKYKKYFDLFDRSIIETMFDFDEFFAALFANIDVRTQERLMERITTVHTLLFSNTKKDYSFMCFELMWMVFTEVYRFTKEIPILYSDREELSHFYVRDNVIPVFSKYLEELTCTMRVAVSRGVHNRITYYRFSGRMDIPHFLLYYLAEMFPDASVKCTLNAPEPDICNVRQNCKELKELSELLRIIR